MYSKEDLFNQALEDMRAVRTPMPKGYGVINNWVKIQKFPSKIELINLSKGGSYYVECTEEEYKLFYE